MPSCLDDFGVLESNPLVLLGQVAGSTADVVAALRLTRDAGDPQEVFEFLEPLVAGIFEEYSSGAITTGYWNTSPSPLAGEGGVG